MTILFDMVHPADVHFFKHCIHMLCQRGDIVVVTSRKKDLTIELLDPFQISHTPISRAGKGRRGLLFELLTRNANLWKIAKTCIPDLYISNNSPCAAHIAWFMHRPSIVFDDTETHRYSHRLYYPCVTEIHSPRCYRSPLGPKQRFYNGYHALAYLHPHHFTPEPEVLRQAGLNPAEPMVLLRFVGWGAIHDIGRKKLEPDHWFRVIRLIQNHARIFISAEGRLPDELEPYRLSLPIESIHHLLFSVKLLISDSGSMTSEAVVLGTPAVYCDDIGLGYTDEQEARYGLCFNFTPDEIDSMLNTITTLLHIEKTRQYFAQTHARLLQDNLDVAAYQLEQIDRICQHTP